MNKKRAYKHQTEGFVVPLLLGLIVGFSVLVVVIAQVVTNTLGSAVDSQKKQEAFHIAEAGINYYLWHMNHNATDFKDGASTPTTPDVTLGYGPYEHEYRDGTGSVRGKFRLYIKPGQNGSNIATIRSTGIIQDSPYLTRTIRAQIGAPSFSTYGVLSNAEMWFGNEETADGPIHSNVGVKMDGPNSSEVTAGRVSYEPQSSGPGSGYTQNGVWCDPGIVIPIRCTTRSKDSWRYPAVSPSFNSITANLCTIRKTATNNTPCTTRITTRTPGYVPSLGSFDTQRGYLITLNNNGTYTLHKVTDENDDRTPYTAALGVSNTTLVQANIAIPNTGVIFVEDNVWLRTEPSGFNGRVTIATSRLSTSEWPTVTIVDNVKYADKYAGNDVIGVIAVKDVEIAPYAPAPIEINAALIAQKGSVQIRRLYRSYLPYKEKTPGYAAANQGLSFFGSVASNERWTWSVYYSGGNENYNSSWSGYRYTTTKYDENLRYSPPPSFPVTSTYDILEWREILTDV